MSFDVALLAVERLKQHPGGQVVYERIGVLDRNLLGPDNFGAQLLAALGGFLVFKD